MITNEIIYTIKRNEIEGIILKIDFDKTFDSMNWNFFLNTLK